MPQIFRRFGEPVADSGLASWQGLNANFRGEEGHTVKPSLTVSDAANHLIRAGLSWSAPGQGVVVSFAFRATAGALPLDVGGFAQFTAGQIQATLLALQSWSDVADITFVRQDNGTGYSNNATILFGNYSAGADGAAAFAALPGSTAFDSAAGDVWVNRSLAYNALPTMWGYGQHALVHEIGHAIGLLHPGDYNAEPGVEITYAGHASYYEDSNQYTAMSYFGEGATGASFGAGRYVSAPMLDDIAAVQQLYGANLGARTGDTIYGFNSNADRPWFSAVLGLDAPIFAVWDAGGTDTFDFSGYSINQLIDLRQGSFSNVGGLGGNVSIAVGAVIENAIGGAGDDQFFGNSADNRFTPGAGQNRVDGGLGIDTVVFSGPQSAYTITWNGPDCFVSGPEGSSRVRNVEYLAFSDGVMQITAPGGLVVIGDITDEVAHGSEWSDNISGSDGDDQIYGFAGSDQLIGGRGNDLVDGGAGNDIVYIDRGDDTLIGGDGTDTLDLESSHSGIVVDLEAGVMTGDWSGSDLVSGFERIIGSRQNDQIRGDGADNYIQGFAGIDLIHGGGGDDELVGSWLEVGGAEDVIKSADQANGSIATALSLDKAFDRLDRDGIFGFGQPHATVLATTHGGYEYYAFTAGANADVNFDVDGASFDTVIRIFDSAGVEVARNDDATYNGDGGSPGDSFLNVRLVAAGTYYVQVGAYASGSGAAVQSAPAPAGQSYTLHVTVPGHATEATYAQGSELFGDAGSDTLRGTDGRDILDGGAGDDTIWAGRESDVIRGGEGWDTVHLIWDASTNCRLLMVSEGEYLLKGPEGADHLSGIEIIRFGDGVTVDLGRLYSLGAFDGRPEGVWVDELAAIASGLIEPLVLPPAELQPKADGGAEDFDLQVLPGEGEGWPPLGDPSGDYLEPDAPLPEICPIPPRLQDAFVEQGRLLSIDRLVWSSADPFARDPSTGHGAERTWDWLE